MRRRGVQAEVVSRPGQSATTPHARSERAVMLPLLSLRAGGEFQKNTYSRNLCINARIHPPTRMAASVPLRLDRSQPMGTHRAETDSQPPLRPVGGSVFMHYAVTCKSPRLLPQTKTGLIFRLMHDSQPYPFPKPHFSENTTNSPSNKFFHKCRSQRWH